MINSSSEIGFWSYHPLTHVTGQDKNVEDRSYPIEIEKIKGFHYLNVKENEKTTDRVHVFIANDFFRKIKYFFLKYLTNNWTEITLDKPTSAAQPDYKKSIKLLIDNRDFLNNRSASQKIESIFGSALSEKIPELKQEKQPIFNEDDLSIDNEDLDLNEIEKKDYISSILLQKFSLNKVLKEINDLKLPDGVKKLFTQKIEFIQKLSNKEVLSEDESGYIAEIITKMNDFINVYETNEKALLALNEQDYQDSSKISKNLANNLLAIYLKIDDLFSYNGRLTLDSNNFNILEIENFDEQLYFIKKELFLRSYQDLIFKYKNFEKNLESFNRKVSIISKFLSFEMKILCSGNHIRTAEIDKIKDLMNKRVNIVES